ncbi:MAG: hypothetical protein AAF587_26355 [Bacteroidota bacterium]
MKHLFLWSVLLTTGVFSSIWHDSNLVRNHNLSPPLWGQWIQWQQSSTYIFTFSIEEHDWISSNDAIVLATARISVMEGGKLSIEWDIEENKNKSEEWTFTYEVAHKQFEGEFHMTMTFATPKVIASREKIQSEQDLSQDPQIHSRSQAHASDGAHIMRTYSFATDVDEEGIPILIRLDHHPESEIRTMPFPTSMKHHSPWYAFEGYNLEFLIKNTMTRSK